MGSPVGTNFFSPKTSTLDIALTDKNGNAYLAKCVGAAPTTAGIFGVGCLIIRDNGACYTNTGTVAVPVWTLVGTVVALSVDTAELANGAVTLAKLDAGITPSHIVAYAGKENNGGGAATIAITVAGVVATDIAFAQVQESTNAVSVQKVTPSIDTVTVLLSGDPGAATVISYQVLRFAT